MSHLRRAKQRRAVLESLEQRTLLSTLPPAIIDRSNVSAAQAGGEFNDESSPSIAVDPTNPNRLVSSWTRYNTAPGVDANQQISVQAAFSTNGGASWTPLAVPGRRIDPNSGDNPTFYPSYADASVAFGRDGSFYLLSLQNNGVTAGELILRRYDPADPTQFTTTNVYQWNRSDEEQDRATAVSHPILAVDNTAPVFTDPDGEEGNIINPHAGNIYVAYIGDTPPPESPPPNWNPLTVNLLSSTDNGETFGGPLILNQGGNGGDQRNTRPRIAVSQGGGGSQPGQVTVVWDDFATGAGFNVPTSFIRSRVVTNGGQTLGTQALVGTSLRVLGNAAGGGTVGGLTANGIGPQPSIAVDNTLGINSPHQGRIYVAFAARESVPLDDQQNPIDNTDIILAFSDTGGASWTSAGRVNDDEGRSDGFSGAREDIIPFVGPVPTRGRPQFTPEVAVDPGTGTVVVQFYDTRHDASRLRPATYITASINGGASFSEQVFVNQPETVFDVATGTFRTVGPIPDNQSGGNPIADNLFGFGVRQGLAVLDGRVYSARSSNLNAGNSGEQYLDIQVVRATLPSGPRVIDGQAGVVSTTNTSGTPQAQSFEITFDRPIDPSTFDTDDIAIRYRSPDGSIDQPIAANNIVPLSTTRFRVEFPASTSPGTYSYAIGPNIQDNIRTTNVDGTVNLRLGNLVDQDGNAVSDLGQGGDVRFSAPRSLSTTDVFNGPFQRDSLPLIVPGPRVVATRAVLADGSTIVSSDPVLNDRVNGIEVDFDRDMETSTFTVEDVLRIVGPAGEVDRSSMAVVPINPTNGSARTFRVTFAEQQLSGTYQVVLGSNIQSILGHLVDSNGNAGVDVLRGGPASTSVELSFASTEVPLSIPANGVIESTIEVDKAFEITDVNVQLNISHTNVPNLRAELIAPNGQVILLFQNVGATGDRSNFTNTIFDSQASQSITAGTPPFSDRYRPLNSLNVLNSPLGEATEAGTYTLRITNTGGVTGTLNNWRLIMQERVTGTGLGEPVADRIQADFSIFTMDPTNGLSSSTWTPVGPAPVQNGEGAGRVSAVTVDPSDPTGNTVYLGAASGGVWKTNNFLTTDSGGPTWIPLTDAVQANGLNIGGITVFGRNNDPNQSIVMVATGEGPTGTAGVGFLRSMDGGSSWELLDSADNRVPFAQRGREFVGTRAFKLQVDPSPTSTGQAIFYAALSGAQGGLWRSTDSGDTWQQLRAGQATDIVLDPGSGTPSVNNPTGNLQILYAAFQGEGVFISPNQGQQLNLMAGGVGKPRVRDGDGFDPTPVPVGNLGVSPNGGGGRILLAKPALSNTGDPVQDARQNLLYQGWLYALVATEANTLDGLYMTKDQGQNWTQLRIPTETHPTTLPVQYTVIPSNNTNLADHDPTQNAEVQLANYALALTIDPTNPHIVYFGGTRNNGGESALIRVDSTFVHDPHAFYLSSELPDGGQRRNFASGPAVLKDGDRINTPLGQFEPRDSGMINLYRNPADPFDATATVLVNRTASFSNTGAGVKWTPFDAAIGQTTDVQTAFSLIDPLTGHGRLIFGVDRGIFTAVDAGDGTVLTSIGLGNTTVVGGSRNGNLQISQIYAGAVQPSQAAADVAGALFYAQTDGNGFPRSSSDILSTGNLAWNSPRLATEAGSLSGSDVATDPSGSGASYQYNWRNGGDSPKFPGGGGDDFRTDFFLVDLTANGNPHDVVGRTSGLIQAGTGLYPDPQWPVPNRNAVVAGAPGGAQFTVNPIDADQIIISAPNGGRVFRTLDRGQNWLTIGQPGALGNSYFPALAFGAPEPGAEPGNIGDYIIGGNVAGQVYVTFTGGGAAGDQWTQINTGDLEGNTAPVQAIATNPIRGTYEAYLLTTTGIYHLADTRAASGETWTNVTSDLFGVTHNIFGDEDFEAPLLAAAGLRSLAIDWRYAIPSDFDNPPVNPTDPNLTHPVIYLGGVGGVFVSYNDGGSWNRFPSAFPNSINTTPEIPGDGGGLPVVEVRDLDLSLGNISRATGLPVNQEGDPNLLMASTWGRGAFAIRIAPVVFPESLRLVLGEDRLPIAQVQLPEINLERGVVFEGFSAQTAADNEVEIRAFLIGDDGSLQLLPLTGETLTDSSGRFRIEIDTSVDGVLGDDGPKRIGIQAIDGAGVAGNIAVYDLILDTVPPATPIVLFLQPGSDSGFSNSDNYTNAGGPPIAAPTFDVGPVLEEGLTLELFRNGVLVASMSEVPLGETVAITDDDGGTGVPDGTYTYLARLVDRAGNESLDSPSLVVTIDTVSPSTPTVPALLPADDSGVPGDGITNVRQPRFFGSMVLADNELSPENLPLVQIFSGSGTVLGQARVNPDGSYMVQIAVPLTDGVYVLQARALDRAGNESNALPGQSIRIDTTLPPGVTLGLSPVDDTGPVGDNITRIQQPRLIGTTGAGLQVELIDVGGNVPGGGVGVVVAGPVISQPDGAYTLQIPFDLPDGTYTLVARVTNVAGNTIDSLPLELTILTEAGVGTPTLRLAPESDTGFLGDGRTTVRRPFFVGEGAGPNTVVDIVGPGGALLATGTTNDDGTYRLQLPSNLANGTIVLRARFRGASGVSGPFSAPFSLTIESLTGDFNNDGRADRAVYRPGIESGQSQFFLDRTTGGNSVIDSAAFQSNDPSSPLFGFELRPTDLPLTGDFDGDGIADVAVFRPESDRMPGASEWFILGSRTGPRSILFGGSGLDTPAVGDFDGDGITDVAVFRPVSDLLPGAAEWFILPSSTGQAYRVSFGAAGGLDLPAVADFDGDGRAEIAVFRPSSDLFPGEAQWFILPSSSNDLSFSEMRDGYSVRFGQAGVDQPIPLDYDGDGRADIATYRPTTSEWFIYRSGLPMAQAGLRVEFGQPGDIPAPGDYDGDGIADLAYFRPTNAEWTIRQSSLGTDLTTDPFGIEGDLPLLAPLAYRDPRVELIGSPASAVGASAAQARQVAGSPLDLGGQAARLNGVATSGAAVRSSQTDVRSQRLEARAQARAQALADAADRQRVLRDDAGDRSSTGLRSLLADFWARRLGGHPRA